MGMDENLSPVMAASIRPADVVATAILKSRPSSGSAPSGAAQGWQMTAPEAAGLGCPIISTEHKGTRFVAVDLIRACRFGNIADFCT
jgi:hypothetical protein